MAEHIIVDPITRIEGHLRIEAIIDDNGVISDAYASSTMFRGIETILKGRDPRDAGLLAMRICGVCTGTHYQRSIEAVEHAFNVTIPKNARIVRNSFFPKGRLLLFFHGTMVSFPFLTHFNTAPWTWGWIHLTFKGNLKRQEPLKKSRFRPERRFLTLGPRIEPLGEVGKNGQVQKAYSQD